jgi:DNA polymerase-3 subunit epsilon
LIFFDTETTGLLKPEANDLNLQPYITELYAVKMKWEDDSFKFISEFDSLFKVPVPLEPFITKITGITDEMLSTQPTFAEKADELAEFWLGERAMVGHNLSFDQGMLWVELARLEKEVKFPWCMDHQCTVELSMPIKNHRLKLGDLFEMATGSKHTNAHRAKGDVLAMVKSYEWMVNEGHLG